MPKYKKCPRCELNYILEDQNYCDICLSALNGEILDDINIDDEEDLTDDLVLCPICKRNLISKSKSKCKDCQQAEEELKELKEDIPTKDETQDNSNDDTKSIDDEEPNGDDTIENEDDEGMDDDDLEALKGTETDEDLEEDTMISAEELEDEENEETYADDFYDDEYDEYDDPLKGKKKVKIRTESDIEDYTEQKPAPKKRGRPKKNA